MLLRRAEAFLAERTGLTVTVGDVQGNPLTGRLSFTDLQVRTGHEAPLVVVEQVELALAPYSLLKPPLLLHRLALEGVLADASLQLPLPAPRTAGSQPLQLVIPELVVGRATLVGLRLPQPLKPYLKELEPLILAFHGSLTQGRLAGELVAQGAVTDTAGTHHPLHLALAFAADQDGSFELPQAKLESPGLVLTASAKGRQPFFSATANVEADLARFLPQLGLAGQVAMDLQLPPAGKEALVALRAQGVSLAGLGLLASSPLAPLELAQGSWELEGQARLPWPFDPAASIPNTLWARWKKEGITAVTAQLASSFALSSLTAQFELSLLPEEPGTRHLAGKVRISDLSQLESAQLDQVKLVVFTPSLRRTLQTTTGIWPRLLPALPGELPLDGALELVAQLHGPAMGPEVQLEANYTSGKGVLQLKAQGRLPELAGEAELSLGEVQLEGLKPQLAGLFSGRIRLAGTPSAWRGKFGFSAQGVGAGQIALDEITAEGETDGRGVAFSRIYVRQGQNQLAGSLTVPSLKWVDQVRGRFEVSAPSWGLEEAQVLAELTAGSLTLDVAAFHTAVGPLWLVAQLPLGTLAPGLGERLTSLPLPKAQGPLFLQLTAPSLDSCRWVSMVPAADRPERVVGGVEAALQVDPQQPTVALGRLVLAGVRLEREGKLFGELPRGEMVVADGRVRLSPTSLSVGSTVVAISGEGSLAPRFEPRTDSLSALVQQFVVEARGGIPTALLRPYLGGAKASGELALLVRAEGSPQRFSLWTELDGRSAEFFWPSPYPARLAGFSARAHRSPGGDVTFTAQGELNGGALALVGSRSVNGDGELQVELAGGRFRLDLGLLVQADASLLLSLPAQGERSLTGKVHLARAQLERPLSLEGEVIPFFLAPTATPGTGGGLLDTVALDVAVESESGVRVRNNLADLRVRWDELYLRGTPWRPHLQGQLEVDPGGVVRAWGQTLRLDRLVATFTGDPFTDPRLELAVTSSWEDPTVRHGQQSVLAHLAGEPAPGASSQQQAAGLASTRFLGSAAAATLAQALGSAAEVRLEPVLVFAEADPSARLTVSRPLNAYASFALSLDLRSAQRQTYLVELRNLPRFPSLTAQVFTNDAGNAGSTVQQFLSWGAGKQRVGQDPPTLRRVVWEAPRFLRRKPLLRALGIQRGMALPEEIQGDWKLELEYLLRQQGYPDAQVQLTRKPVPGKKNQFDLHVAINPGEPVAFSFRSNKLPKGQLPLIRALYRSGVWEDSALEDIREAAVRVFRAMGYLDPEVEVAVAPATAQRPRLVTVTPRLGRRLPRLATLKVPALPEEEQAVVRGRFAGKVELMELAAGLPSAQDQLRSALASLGYPRPRILRTFLDDKERTLVVAVDPGPREVFGEVRISGATSEELSQLRSLIACKPGQPARRDRIAAAATAVTAWYQAQGFPQVRVIPRLAPHPRELLVLDLELAVEKGEPQRVEQVVFEGRRRLADSLAKKLVGLVPGEPLVLQKVYQGRRRLWATGLFRTVRAAIVPQKEGTARVLYHLQEEPSISLAYGLRWEATQGIAGVVDFADRNLLGRRITLGLRGLYEKNQQSGRVFLGFPDLLASGVQGEAFLERRRRTTEATPGAAALVEDSTRFTLQLQKALAASLVAHFYGRWQKTHIFERTDFFPLDITLRFPYAGLGLTYDSRDDKVLAQRGLFLSLDLSGTGQLLGADLEFVRLYGQLANFRPWSWGKLTLSWAQSLRVGWATTGAGQELIRSERFFAGGEYSVRGYPVDSLGPLEDLGYTSRPAGGKAMVVINQELRIPLPRDVVGILFLDAGQVWAEASQVRWEDLVLASGVGVRARTPLGMLRLDLALPWEKSVGNRKPKIYLGFGSIF